MLLTLAAFLLPICCGGDMQAEIKAHAEAEYPRECCGLIVAVGKKERYIPCRNTADGPTAQFRMHPEDWASAEDLGEVLCVVHSHPDLPAQPSEADRAACEESGLPWLIVSVREGVACDVHQFAPTGWKAPLLGRPFFHGVLDCYTLVRDVYQRQLNITLLDFERQDDWWKKGQDLYMEGFKKAGFRKLQDGEAIAPYDVILMAINGPVASHGGVYLGDVVLREYPDLHPLPNAMIQHLHGRLSARVVYGGYWQQVTRAIVRYEQ